MATKPATKPATTTTKVLPVLVLTEAVKAEGYKSSSNFDDFEKSLNLWALTGQVKAAKEYLDLLVKNDLQSFLTFSNQIKTSNPDLFLKAKNYALNYLIGKDNQGKLPKGKTLGFDKAGAMRLTDLGKAAQEKRDTLAEVSKVIKKLPAGQVKDELSGLPEKTLADAKAKLAKIEKAFDDHVKSKGETTTPKTVVDTVPEPKAEGDTAPKGSVTLPRLSTDTIGQGARLSKDCLAKAEKVRDTLVAQNFSDAELLAVIHVLQDYMASKVSKVA